VTARERVYLAPTADVRAWLVSEGFVPGDLDSWELAYAHCSGHGYVTLRFWPHDYGWDAIVRSPIADSGGRSAGVNLGTCATLDQMRAVLVLLGSFRREHYVDAQGQRTTPTARLVERRRTE